MPMFSIVVPVLNEQESLSELVASIDGAMSRAGRSYEIVFVDDGSTDRTLTILKDLASARSDVRVFSFRRNFGKSRALLCGFHMSHGDFIVTMDADLQDDPANIAGMFDYLTSTEADIVNGWRRERRDSALKRVSSRLFNRLTVRLLFGTAYNDMNSGLKLYKADVARELRLYGGMHRFIPLIATQMGYRVVEFPVKHNERKYGVSKYRSAKILTEVPDLLTMFFLLKYTNQPLHFFMRVGSALFAVGFACLLYLTFLWTRSIPIGTRPLLLFGVLLVLIGGQTIFTGLLADLIVNVSQERREDFPLKYASDASDRRPEPTRAPVDVRR